MGILDYFQDEKDVTVVINRYTNVMVDGVPTRTATVIDTVSSIFYLSSQARGLIADKYRESVDAVCIVDVGTDILKNDNLDINNKKWSVVADPDNVALRDEASVVLIKELD